MANAPAKKLIKRRSRLMKLQQRVQLLSAFGYRLKQLRLAKGFTPSEFEVTSNIDAGNLTKYERGEREPGLIVITMMAKALGVRPSELVDFDLSADIATKASHNKVGLLGDPITILRSLMKENGLRPRDLTKILGISRGLASNILNYRRGLSKGNIRALAEYFHLDQEVFNRSYDLIE